MSLAIRDAAQVLRFPEEGLVYLRHDRAAELTLDPGEVELDGADAEVDARGCAVLPGLVDCHTHLPFAGWRAEEYERKVTGVPYEEIARLGGGIAASARALAAASDAEVLAQAEGLADELLRHGTTAFEGKTGYGMSRDGEARAARLGRELAARVVQPMRVTGLFAHAVPPGFTAASWMDEAEALARACDVDALDIFVESVAFGLEQLGRMGTIAAEIGLPLRAHVEQLSTMRSVPVALRHGARSVDHLSVIHPDDVAPLAASETAAVLLPGAELMNAEATAPARALADAGAICVLATDFNPGTSPIASLPLITGLAVRRYGWSVREALLATTLNAAYVLGWSGALGSLEPGKRADAIVLDGPAEQLPYRFGHNPVAVVIVAGELAYVRPDQAWRVRS
jgi:imidazolonepropionase